MASSRSQQVMRTLRLHGNNLKNLSLIPAFFSKCLSLSFRIIKLFAKEFLNACEINEINKVNDLKIYPVTFSQTRLKNSLACHMNCAAESFQNLKGRAITKEKEQTKQ